MAIVSYFWLGTYPQGRLKELILTGCLALVFKENTSHLSSEWTKEGKQGKKQ